MRELVGYYLIGKGRLKIPTNEAEEYVRNNCNKIRQIRLDYRTT